MKHSNSTFLKTGLLIMVMTALLCGMDSCKMPNNGVPFYIHVDSPTVVSSYGFGSASSRIPTVWGSEGSHNLGAYEMPVNIPILDAGSVFIALSAGIYDNGITSAQAQYPFYVPDTFTLVNPIAGHVYRHHPIYRYYANTQIALNADFEVSNPFNNITPLNTGPDSTVYEGLRSGGILMGLSDTAVTAVQTVPAVINTNGRESYVELNWKITNPNVFCDVGVIATQYSGTSITEQTIYPKITFQSLGHWQKTYLNFDNEIGANPGLSFQVYFTAYHTQGRLDTVYLDNVKILYFN